jgi:hypothetical protein
MAQQSIHDRIMSHQPAVKEEEAPRRVPRPVWKSSSRALKRVALFGTLSFLVLAGAGLAFHFYPATLGALLAGVATAQSQTPAEKTPAKGETPFHKHVSQAGIRSCANVFPALGQVLTLGSSYAVNTQWNSTSPDAHPVQAVTGMNYDMPDYKAQAAGIVFASPIGEGCEGNLVRVAPFQKTCEEVVGTLPKGSVLAETLSGTPLYNLANNTGQALLVPTGSSCVVVSVARLAG